MATYINLTKMPLPVTPSVGDSFIIPPKQSAVLTPEQESSPNLVTLLQKGLVKRLADEPVVVAEPAPVKAEEVAPKAVEAESEPALKDEKGAEKAVIEKRNKKPL